MLFDWRAVHRLCDMPCIPIVPRGHDFHFAKHLMSASPTSLPRSTEFPLVLAGPILRRLEPQRLAIWLVASEILSTSLVLSFERDGHRVTQEIVLNERQCRTLSVGRHAHLHLLDVTLQSPLPLDTVIEYDVRVHCADTSVGVADWGAHMLHADAQRPNFVLKAHLDNLLFGSCRKPHSPAPDGLVKVDELVEATLQTPAARPALLLLCGDQVYADDVAGPMLAAIHALIKVLGLHGEYLEGAVVADSDALYSHDASYYRREELLPAFQSNEALRERFFGGVEKPVFTTANAHNHLVTLAEVIAMYLLVWSPVCWRLLNIRMPALSLEHASRYCREEAILAGFRADLPRVARGLAHIQTLMIFDDHDITDDWNLSARWELTAYGHPLSRRIVGNALIAYALCQGWGNNPDVFDALLQQSGELASTVGPDGHLDCKSQNRLIDEMLKFGHWHYVLPTKPALIVLDTRTHRWRNARHLSRPSGLMDWEALSEFQQHLLDQPSALIVSPAPMFGVKLIETIQRALSWAGQSLMVDAENWMAHRGAASVMLNIFRHSRTPGNYVILSGDVHYSFVYDIHLRHQEQGPRIWQITSSGLKNEFPRTLLKWLDRLNRWLYAPWSPLNWLTKRRDMEVVPRLPNRRQAGERLWNAAGVGQVFLNHLGQPTRILQHNADGSTPTCFEGGLPSN